MSGGLDLEQRYRRVLRLLPGYYRDKWEEDMVAAFLDGWLTGDPDEDSVTMEYDRPTRGEIVSVIVLGGPLRLRGVGGAPQVAPWRRRTPPPLLRLGAGGAERGAGSDAGARGLGSQPARAVRPQPPPDRLAPATAGRVLADARVRDR